MRFILKRILLNNFKGFEKMDVEFSPKSTLIEGDNETGKTTLYDAFCYCINKKSSDGSTDFGIKPNFATEIVSPSVEVEAEIDDKPVTLKRVYQAKFTKDKKFSGYKTECFINGIPVGIKEFEEYISDCVGQEEVFKLLTFPNYFTELMTISKGETVSQRQCKALRHMANVESDKNIAESENAFKPLVELLKRYDSVDDIQKFYKAEVKRIHQEIDDIPIKVEQQAKNIIDVDQSETELNTRLRSVSAKIEALRAQPIPTPECINEVNTIKEKLESAKKELSEVQNAESKLLFGEKNKYIEILNEVHKEQHKKNLELSSLESQMNELESKIYALEFSVKVSSDAVGVNEIKLRELKLPNLYCPTCGAELTEEKLSEYMNDLEEKRKSLKEYIAKGETSIKSAENEIEDLQNKVNELSAEKEETQKELQRLKEKEAESEEDYKESISLVKDSISSKIQEKRSNLEILEEKLKEANSKYDETLKKVQLEISNEQISMADEKQSIVLELSKIDNNKRCRRMIQELEESRDRYSEELDKAQMFLDLSEEFIQKRSKLLEKSVNKLFDNVKFKFTREAKSGKIIETCTPTFNGQNYQDLSASTKLICNLDIVKGFQRYYNAYLPLFIDNAEGITETLDCDTQTVLLSVKKEVCPKCGAETGRKQENRLWKCKECGYEFKKHFEVNEG